jgi:hypothetical protein
MLILYHVTYSTVEIASALPRHLRRAFRKQEARYYITLTCGSTGRGPARHDGYANSPAGEFPDSTGVIKKWQA